VTFQATDNSGNTTEDSITVTVAAPTASAESMTIYEASISNQIIQARCVNCHGSNASLRLIRSGISGYVNTNYNSMVNYIRGGGSSSILSKPQGIGHGGGVQLSTGSPDLSNLKQFVSAVLSE
jgi:mono/diheme cytochrome c family protein